MHKAAKLHMAYVTMQRSLNHPIVPFHLRDGKNCAVGIVPEHFHSAGFNNLQQ